MRKIGNLADSIARIAYERESSKKNKPEPDPVRRDMLKFDMSYNRWLRAIKAV